MDSLLGIVFINISQDITLCLFKSVMKVFAYYGVLKSVVSRGCANKIHKMIACLT